MQPKDDTRPTGQDAPSRTIHTLQHKTCPTGGYMPYKTIHAKQNDMRPLGQYAPFRTMHFLQSNTHPARRHVPKRIIQAGKYIYFVFSRVLFDSCLPVTPFCVMFQVREPYVKFSF